MTREQEDNKAEQTSGNGRETFKNILAVLAAILFMVIASVGWLIMTFFLPVFIIWVIIGIAS